MNRIDFLNAIYEKCDSLSWDGTAKPQEILSAVRKYRNEKNFKFLSEYLIEVVNGFLFLDGDPIIRIEPLIRPFNLDLPEAAYYEGKCIRDFD